MTLILGHLSQAMRLASHSTASSPRCSGSQPGHELSPPASQVRAAPFPTAVVGEDDGVGPVGRQSRHTLEWPIGSEFDAHPLGPLFVLITCAAMWTGIILTAKHVVGA